MEVKSCNKQRFQCRICTKTSTTKGNLEKHMVLHNENRETYQCEICLKVLRTKFGWEHHKKSHSNANKDQEKIQCAICEIKVSPYVMKTHMTLHDESHESHSCSLCSKTFRTKSMLQNHVRNHERDSQSATCEICGKTVKLVSFRQHIKTHSDSVNHTCHCGKDYKTKEALNYHIKTSHDMNGERFKCDLCPKDFKSLLILKYFHYKKFHVENRPKFSCDICEKEVSNAQNLKRHKQTHEVTRTLLKCDTCGKGLTYKSDLEKHVKSENSRRVEGAFQMSILFKRFFY